MSLLYKYKYDIISVYVFLEKAKKPLQTQDDKPHFSATMLCIISTVPHIPGNGLLLHGLELSEFHFFVDDGESNPRGILGWLKPWEGPPA